MAAYKEGTYQNFRQRPMSNIAWTNSPLCGLGADMEEKQT